MNHKLERNEIVNECSVEWTFYILYSDSMNIQINGMTAWVLKDVRFT